MGSITILLSVLATCLIIDGCTAAGASCPLASKVQKCNPSCVQNYDCSHGKVCCPNSCNAKSCVEPSPYGSHGSEKDKHSQSGAGIYCNNVKCNSFEVCKLDHNTKRMKCQRP